MTNAADQLALFPETERDPRPLAGCVAPSYHAGAKVQRHFATQELRAVRQHRPVRPIREARQALLHAALAASR